MQSERDWNVSLISLSTCFVALALHSFTQDTLLDLSAL